MKCYSSLSRGTREEEAIIYAGNIHAKPQSRTTNGHQRRPTLSLTQRHDLRACSDGMVPFRCHIQMTISFLFEMVGAKRLFGMSLPFQSGSNKMVAPEKYARKIFSNKTSENLSCRIICFKNIICILNYINCQHIFQLIQWLATPI